MSDQLKKQALEYHINGRPGKIEVVPTVPYSTQYDLSLAYTPGVAVPCKAIEANPEDAYLYTAKGNLVAVISNGTAVLGLGNIGALAGKPVMEGKGLLFKVFADVDVFDIEVNQTDIDAFIETVKAISPTFGGINLEDIKAPECFEIEQRLIEELDIPVFHDDQHGTAIISAAGLINALELNGKRIEDVVVVVNGAGAAAVSCIKLYLSMGVKAENVLMVDSKGVLNTKRKDLNEVKKRFVTNRDADTLRDAMKGADVFLGLSVADVVDEDMVKSMAKDPIVFAMANPNPEIAYDKAISARKDIIFATGRSDYPNQINNVLGFPYIFRGALDVRASKINEAMKIAAVVALAELAKEDVPETVNIAYKKHNLIFGREYLIPKPVDPRLITRVAPAVAKAAIESGVAANTISDWDAYTLALKRRMGIDNKLIRKINSQAKSDPKRVLYGQAENYKVLKAVQAVKHQGLAKPMLLGNREEIIHLIEENSLDLEDIPIIDIGSNEQKARRRTFAAAFCAKRERKGITYDEAILLMRQQSYFGSMMVESGEADAFLSGSSSKYVNVIRPALQVIGTRPVLKHIAGMYILFTKKGPFFFADTTVNRDPDTQTIVDTTLLAAEEVRKFNMEPKIAMVSYSNYGSVRDGSPKRITDAVNILHEKYPDLIVDGEMQANFAFNRELRKSKFPFSKLAEHDVNTIIFPNLNSGNIAYKMMQEIGGADVIGPILMGMNKPVHILQMESSVREIVYLTAIAVVDAQCAADPECGRKYSIDRV
ncbi:MAG: NADP-dependent malic enzyme [Bacteroidota bacterium]|nr:NADP-dependent malic enzyme [Bacteroidota bacterium]